MTEIIDTLKEMLKVFDLVGIVAVDDDRIAALTEAISAMEWVKVSDRLPENNAFVLMVQRFYGIPPLVDCGWFNGKDWYNAHGSRLCNISHWKPLPPAPGGE